MPDVTELTGNRPELGQTGRYAAILGEQPSKGARSPALWNAVFGAEGLDLRFHPLDVTREALPALVAALKADGRFVGGSVTMPHKPDIVPLLDEVEPLAERIGAVNALYRKDGKLVGANTDGAAALTSLLASLGDSSVGRRKAVLIGVGGAGTAVACYLADALGPDGRLVLANRTLEKAEALAARIGGGIEVVGVPPDTASLSGADIVINCTSVGFATPENEGAPQNFLTALGPLADRADNTAATNKCLAATKPDAMVFDIIYQPAKTALLTLAEGCGRRTLNGLGMNLEQAVIAFGQAIADGPSAERVRHIMARIP